MKKFFYLILLGTLFFSCSKEEHTHDSIIGNYSGDKLEVTSENNSLLTSKVEISETDATDGIALRLYNTIPSTEYIQLEGKKSEPNAKGEYSIDVQGEIEGMTLSMTGIISNGIAKLQLRTNITATDILHSYTFEPSSMLYFNYSSISGKTPMIDLEDSTKTEATDEEYIDAVSDLFEISSYVFKKGKLIFNENGYASIHITPKPLIANEEIQFDNIVRYYYNETEKKLYFSFNTDTFKKKSEDPNAQILPSDITLAFDVISNDKSTTFKLDKKTTELGIRLLTQYLSSINLSTEIDKLIEKNKDLIIEKIGEDYASLLPPILNAIKISSINITNAIISSNLKQLEIGANLVVEEK